MRAADEKLSAANGMNVLNGRWRMFPSKRLFKTNWEETSRAEISLLEFMFILAFFLVLCNTSCNALPLPQDEQSADVVTEKLLISATCTLESQKALQECPLAGSYLKAWLEHCNFYQICKEGRQPICVQTNDGPAFLCSSKNLVCELGMRLYAFKDRNNTENVILIKARCPDGTYQTEQSDCFHACDLLHRKYIPEQYAVYKYGDHMSPTMVYCNYSKGYYNPDGNFLMNFDRDGWDNPYFCKHINKTNPCYRNDDQYPLPNGTCVHPCINKQPRDDHNGFLCKSITSQHSDLGKKMTHKSLPERIYRNDSSNNHTIDSPSNGSKPGVNRNNAATVVDKEFGNGQTKSPKEVIIGVMIAGVIVVFVITVLACRIKSGRWIWEGFEKKTQNEQNDKCAPRKIQEIVRAETFVKSGKKTTINIFQNNPATVENQSDSEEDLDAVEMESLIGSGESEYAVPASDTPNDTGN